MLKEQGVQITHSSEVFLQLADMYQLPPSEVRYIDLNRTGVHLPDGEVRVGFRVRFITDLETSGSISTWFALPVRVQSDTPYSVNDQALWFADEKMGKTHQVELDTCDVSYQRGPRLLNLNSRSRSNCAGCTACAHNYKDLYDQTVIRDLDRLVTQKQIENFFDQKEQAGLDIAALRQIAVVTGLFGSEGAVVTHMDLIRQVVSPRGFKGELMYFGCEVNSSDGLKRLADLGDFALVYAVDNFTKRSEILNRKKGKLTLEDAKRTLTLARALGIQTTFAYIAGIDDLASLQQGFIFLADSITRFPVVNVYQIQTPGQMRIIDEEAKGIEYYIKARGAIEQVLTGTGLRPRRWENYRPLWYDIYAGQPLPSNTFGE
ncbi:hypothetical protein HYZ06_00290 [Candidatus Daviesbacteria bacterium]|nr:hypothetical protein [Candidatus Daviesbacteria bacterium]